MSDKYKFYEKQIEYALAISILVKSMDSFLSHYNHLVSIGNFNSESDKTLMSNFVEIMQFKMLIKLFQKFQESVL